MHVCICIHIYVCLVTCLPSPTENCEKSEYNAAQWPMPQTKITHNRENDFRQRCPIASCPKLMTCLPTCVSQSLLQTQTKVSRIPARSFSLNPEILSQDYSQSLWFFSCVCMAHPSVELKSVKIPRSKPLVSSTLFLARRTGWSTCNGLTVATIQAGRTPRNRSLQSY